MPLIDRTDWTQPSYRWQSRPRRKRLDIGYIWGLPHRQSWLKHDQDIGLRYERARHSVDVLCGRERPSSEEQGIYAEFRKYVDAWRQETNILSSIQAKVFNHNYQRIVGMGPVVLPFILEDLRDHGGYWYWALECITRENPAEGAPDLPAAKAAWLEFGRVHGYIR